MLWKGTRNANNTYWRLGLKLQRYNKNIFRKNVAEGELRSGLEVESQKEEICVLRMMNTRKNRHISEWRKRFIMFFLGNILGKELST